MAHLAYHVHKSGCKTSIIIITVTGTGHKIECVCAVVVFFKSILFMVIKLLLTVENTHRHTHSFCPLWGLRLKRYRELKC